MKSLDAIGIDRKTLSALLGVTSRAVNNWCVPNADVPGTVSAYVRLLFSLPSELQAKEISRAKSGANNMYDGMYAIEFQGRTGQSGVAILVLQKGRIFGHDGGVQYDGVCYPDPENFGQVIFDMNITVLKGTAIVQGIPPQPADYSYNTVVSVDPNSNVPFAIDTPYGPVAVKLIFLREIPASIAA